MNEGTPIPPPQDQFPVPPPQPPSPERLANLRGEIVGLLTGERKPEPQLKPVSSQVVLPYVSLNHNEMSTSLRVWEQGVMRGQDKVRFTVPLEQPITQDNVFIFTKEQGQTHQRGLNELTDEQQLMQIRTQMEQALGGEFNGNFEPEDAEDLLVKVGNRVLELRKAFLPQERALRALTRVAADSYSAKYPNSPMTAYIAEMNKFLQEPDAYIRPGEEEDVEEGEAPTNWRGRDVTHKPYADSLQASTEQITGFIDEQGDIKRGIITTGDRAATLQAWNRSDVTDYVEAVNSETPPTDEQTLEAIDAANFMLNFSLVRYSESTETSLQFPQPDGFSFERGKAPIRSSFGFGVTRGVSVGETDDYGNTPLNTDGKFIDVKLALTDENSKVEAYDYVATQTAERGQSGSEVKMFAPWGVIEVTEQANNGKTETYKVWRVNDGILLQCATADKPTFYPRAIVPQGAVTRKPVIYFYPKKKTEVKATLQYKGVICQYIMCIKREIKTVLNNPSSFLTRL